MSAVVAGAAAVGGAAASIGLGSQKSKLQWSRTKRMMQNRHQWEVRDLRKAGLNPILSAGAAPSMGSPQQSPTPDMQRMGDMANTARQNKALRGQMSHQRMLMTAQANAQGAAARMSDAQAAKAQSEAGYIDTQHLAATYGLPAAELAGRIAQSEMGQLAAKFNVWAPTIQAGAHALGSAALLRMGGARAGAGAAAKTTIGNAKGKPWYLLRSKKKATPRTGLNPKYKDNRYP